MIYVYITTYKRLCYESGKKPATCTYVYFFYVLHIVAQQFAAYETSHKKHKF